MTLITCSMCVLKAQFLLLFFVFAFHLSCPLSPAHKVFTFWLHRSLVAYMLKAQFNYQRFAEFCVGILRKRERAVLRVFRWEGIGGKGGDGRDAPGGQIPELQLHLSLTRVTRWKLEKSTSFWNTTCCLLALLVHFHCVMKIVPNHFCIIIDQWIYHGNSEHTLGTLWEYSGNTLWTLWEIGNTLETVWENLKRIQTALRDEPQLHWQSTTT